MLEGVSVPVVHVPVKPVVANLVCKHILYTVLPNSHQDPHEYSLRAHVVMRLSVSAS